MNTILVYILFAIFFIIGWKAADGESKTQYVRLIDIFIYGPLLIYSSFFIEHMYLGIFLIFVGSTTISYNLRNYLKLRNKKHNKINDISTP